MQNHVAPHQIKQLQYEKLYDGASPTQTPTVGPGLLNAGTGESLTSNTNTSCYLFVKLVAMQ